MPRPLNAKLSGVRDFHRVSLGVPVTVGQASGVLEPDRGFALAPAHREIASVRGAAGSKPDRVADSRLGTKYNHDGVGLDTIRLMAAAHELKRSEPVAGVLVDGQHPGSVELIDPEAIPAGSGCFVGPP